MHISQVRLHQFKNKLDVALECRLLQGKTVYPFESRLSLAVD